MNPLGEPPVIAIIGAGEMGAAIGRRLREAAARILISLNGRSAASADRIRRAGLEVVHDDRRLTDGVDYFYRSFHPPPHLRSRKACAFRSAMRSTVDATVSPHAPAN
jgi:pyrroline-5-carboxylate reductase